LLLLLLLCVHLCLQFRQNLQLDETMPLLQLAMNCSDADTAAAVTRCLPEQLQPAAARKLLITAAVRKHTVVLREMRELQSVQQHIDTTTLESMLGPLVPYGDCIQLLCQLPAAARLRSAAVAPLLLQAVLQCKAEAVYQLCRLPAAQQLTSEHTAKLLEACITASSLHVDGGSTFIYSYIKELPAVAQLSSAMLLQLLHVAVNCGSVCYVNMLCALPAARLISSQELLPLLLAALAALREAITAGSNNFILMSMISDYRSVVDALMVSQLSSAEVSQLVCGIAVRRLERDMGSNSMSRPLVQPISICAAQQGGDVGTLEGGRTERQQ
jgi:hypothetical protein